VLLETQIPAAVVVVGERTLVQQRALVVPVVLE
jgi:hypothetical protein